MTKMRLQDAREMITTYAANLDRCLDQLAIVADTDAWKSKCRSELERAQRWLAQSDSSDEPARRQLDTVAGLEMHAILHPHHLDTSPDLLPCPFCGHEGAFTDGHKRGVSDNYTVAAACSNTSCGVRTPEHYKDRASAAVAWNRRALNRSGE